MRLHIHPTSGHPEGVPEIHLVYRYVFNHAMRNCLRFLGHGKTDFASSPIAMAIVLLTSDTTKALHRLLGTPMFRMSFSRRASRPSSFFPRYVRMMSLHVLRNSNSPRIQPRTGGDTLFTSQVSTLKRLSPSFVAYLKTLKAVHSGVEQANFSRSGRRGGVVRREPVEHVHPLVRRHPVTGEEALYVNKQFTRRIVGLKKEESEAILNFIYNHIASSVDLQARVHWSPNTVVLWDNRITAHVSLKGSCRRAARLIFTPLRTERGC